MIMFHQCFPEPARSSTLEIGHKSLLESLSAFGIVRALQRSELPLAQWLQLVDAQCLHRKHRMRYKSAGVMPVCLAMRASIRGPISSPS